MICFSLNFFFKKYNLVIISYQEQTILRFSKKNLKLFSFLFFLKNLGFFQFNQICDIFCVDYPGLKKRFRVSYIFTSFFLNKKLRLDVFTSYSLPSISNLFLGAGWLEREIWDMFGVFFFNHKDLRRILTDYGFKGFPLRKDFPLLGFYEVSYDLSSTRVVVSNIELYQTYRFFDFKSAWVF